MKKLILLILFTGLSVISACSSLPHQPSASVLQQQQELQAKQVIWQVTHIQGHALSADELAHRPSLSFDANSQQVRGSDGCNRIFGSYQLQGNNLRLSPLASTKMMCINNMQISDQFHLALAKVTSFSVEKQILKLKDQSNHVMMELHSQNH
ncbi:META domain-containing protein [Acinetobacter sp. ANC 4640]